MALGVAGLNYGGFTRQSDQQKTLDKVVTINDENHELLVLVRCAFEPSLKGTPDNNKEEAITAIRECLEREGINIDRIINPKAVSTTTVPK